MKKKLIHKNLLDSLYARKNHKLSKFFIHSCNTYVKLLKYPRQLSFLSFLW